jgi:hypothetical protein
MCGGAGPTSAPVADAPGVHELRDTLVKWNTDCASWTEPEFRKLYHTVNPREATLTDFQARDDYEQSKTQKLIRDKWGPAAEARFAHLYLTDTAEDDQTADITITGDHALIIWKVQDIEKTHMIKTAGRWLMNVHPTFEQELAADPNPKEDDVKIESLMRQATADITAGKYKTATAFLADFEPKYNALVDDDD